MVSPSRKWPASTPIKGVTKVKADISPELISGQQPIPHEIGEARDPDHLVEKARGRHERQLHRQALARDQRREGEQHRRDEELVEKNLAAGALRSLVALTIKVSAPQKAPASKVEHVATTVIIPCRVETPRAIATPRKERARPSID